MSTEALSAIHTCNYYCRPGEHCDVILEWFTGAEMMPFNEAQSREFYRRYDLTYLRFEPAREIRPSAEDVPEGHTLADFRGAYLVWFSAP